MKPNAKQQEFIKAHLQSMIKVRETYDELYDHILTALEEMPDDIPFYDTVYRIVDQDLGGKRGILASQRRAVYVAIKAFAIEYFNCLGRSLSSGIMLAVLPAVGFYYYLMNNNESFRNLLGQTLPHSIILIPASVIAAKARVAKKTRDWQVEKTQAAKLLIKPFANIFMIFFPMILWPEVSNICYKLERAKIITRQLDYIGMPINVATVLFFIIIMHAVIYYNMYKDWSKQLITS